MAIFVGKGRVHPGTGKHGRKLGNDKGQQYKKGDDKGDGDHERILEGGFDIRFDLGLMFNDINQPVKDFRDIAANLAGL